MKEILIISDQHSSRLTYVLDVIFNDFLGVPYRIASEVDDHSHILITYGSKILNEAAINIPNIGLLYSTSIIEWDIKVTNHEGLPMFFYEPTDDRHDVPCDIFSICFFLLSRYEEYYDTPKDQHQRYQSKFSLAVKEHFIGIPIVDLWIKRLAEMINAKFGESLQLTGSYKNETTIDIDLPYAFKCKGLKSFLGLAKDMLKWDMNTLKSRWTFLTNGTDPFDTYDWIKGHCLNEKISPLFFILNRMQKPFDENHLSNTQELTDLVIELNTFGEVAIHPSYSASANAAQVSEEKSFISRSIGSPINKSRQHFLRVDLQKTYNTLIKCGIGDDYSMGYPDVIGFRASTARPYRLYDLNSESTFDITIHPCIAMDVTLRYYMNLSPERSIERCRELVTQVKAVNGTFNFIWHNSSLSEAYGWKAWRNVFIAISKM